MLRTITNKHYCIFHKHSLITNIIMIFLFLNKKIKSWWRLISNSQHIKTGISLGLLIYLFLYFISLFLSLFIYFFIYLFIYLLLLVSLFIYLLCSMVDTFSYFSFQPLLHDWCNKGCGMCYPVCGMMHIKEPLLLIRKNSRFFLLLSDWSFTIIVMPYNCK